MTLSLGLFIYVVFRPGYLTRVVFLDVGQGDSILVRTNKGHNILIDGGPDGTARAKLSRYLPFWDNDLDLVVLTHPHADHLIGLNPIVKRYKVHEFWYNGVTYDTDGYQDLLTTLGQKQIPIQIAKAGDQKVFGDVTFTVLYPLIERPVAEDVNDTSLILLMQQGSFSALFTGDAGVEQEAQMLARSSVPDIDVLKVGHHGSQTSTSSEFLNASRPEVAEMMLGTDNTYGHPHEDVVTRLEANVKTLLRTDQDGDSYILTDGQLYEVHR